MQTRLTHLVSILTLAAIALTLAATPAFGLDSAKSSSTIGISMRVPSQLRANMAIEAEVKAFLDRDFRSRYPVAGPFRSDVADSWIEVYSIQNVSNGYGGYDTRHYFRVIAQHVTGSIAYLDIYVYERSQVEPDQDRLLLERFEVVGWQR